MTGIKMDSDQLMLGGIPEDTASVDSVESVHGGGAIPPVQGAGLPDAGLYMSEEQVRRAPCMHGVVLPCPSKQLGQQKM